MKASEIREIWLSFFASKKHAIESSSSLIPQNDPTLLWINAGVAPLKKYFDGTKKPENPRMVNVQKCIRTNDIENVGKTARHHTFFEMLGNFSIGDYFKKEAITWGYEILTDPKWFGFDKDKLYMTYYPDDIEAKNIWLSLGVDPDHIIPCKDNFWEIGEGPCGPDTEIFYDRGEIYDSRGTELIRDDIENERYIEIWNIVFSQYNAINGLKRSEYPELPTKNIDTGAGLERIACVMQGTTTNFETDLFYPIIQHVEKLSGIKYNQQMEFKVIADHIRSIVAAISDGATLSNEGRGYVLRRLLRRALKHGRTIGLNKPFLSLLIDDVENILGSIYPNIIQMKSIIKKMVLIEEEKFLETIHEGERHFYEALKTEAKQISGATAFKLYDTYGFPLELTVEYAEENNHTVNETEFYKLMEAQKERSRTSRKAVKGMNTQDEAYLNFKTESKFIGYDTLETETKVIKVFDEGIVLAETPFYATSGGQVYDFGWINGMQVTNVTKLPNGQHLHEVEGSFEENEEVLAVVDPVTRLKTIQNHSSAHLFHQAIKDILGSHTHQQGSQVSSKTMRFDFNHYENVTADQILAVEQLVKHYILEKPLEVLIQEMPLEEAKRIGAQALFGEKYGSIVRVVNMGWSIELCGGTHVKNTKEIVDFAIGSCESIGSGIYRVEAVSGANTSAEMDLFLQPLKEQKQLVVDKILKINPTAVIPAEPKIIKSYQDIINYHQYLDDIKQLSKAIEKKSEAAKEKDLLTNLDKFNLTNEKRQVVITYNLEQKILKTLIDLLYDKIKGEVLVLCNISDNKASYLVKSKLNNADLIVKRIAELLNGSGGGKPNFAQGGTQNLDSIEKVLKEIERSL